MGGGWAGAGGWWLAGNPNRPARNATDQRERARVHTQRATRSGGSGRRQSHGVCELRGKPWAQKPRQPQPLTARPAAAASAARLARARSALYLRLRAVDKARPPPGPGGGSAVHGPARWCGRVASRMAQRDSVPLRCGRGRGIAVSRPRSAVNRAMRHTETGAAWTPVLDARLARSPDGRAHVQPAARKWSHETLFT